MAVLTQTGIQSHPASILSQPTSTTTTTTTNKNIIRLLTPALTSSLYVANLLQHLLSATTIFVLFKTYLLTFHLLQQTYYLLLQTYYISSILIMHSYSASFFTLRTSFYASCIAAKCSFWCSKVTYVGVRWGMGKSWKALEPARTHCFREFMIFILGHGNGVLLMVFWPGWIVVGPGVWAVWLWCV